MLMLKLKDVHTYYGESHILQGINLTVNADECVALLGPNGMGKTTTLRTIMGLTPARTGSVQFKGQEIKHFDPFRIARLGIGYVPEDREIFETLTVMQNLKVPFLNLKNRDVNKWKEIEEQIYYLFPVFRARRKQLGGTLSGGEQQMLAIARALIPGEEMILLDEPTEGLAPVLVQKLVEALFRIKGQVRTMLLIEQNIQTAIELADRCYIMEKGRIKKEESVEQFRKRPDILRQYLGTV